MLLQMVDFHIIPRLGTAWRCMTSMLPQDVEFIPPELKVEAYLKNNIETQVTNLASGDGWNPTHTTWWFWFSLRHAMTSHGPAFPPSHALGAPLGKWGTGTSFSMLMGKSKNPPTSWKTKSLFSKPFSNAGFLKNMGNPSDHPAIRLGFSMKSTIQRAWGIPMT